MIIINGITDTASLLITSYLLKFHLTKISNISVFAVSKFHQCLAPINTANKINAELRIFKIIIFKFKKSKKLSHLPFQNIKFYLLVVGKGAASGKRSEERRVGKEWRGRR